MLSQPATKIFLHTSEPRAAKWISDTIGEVEEVEEVEMERTKATVNTGRFFRSARSRSSAARIVPVSAVCYGGLPFRACVAPEG
jgi:Type IV secretion-system coupling protein DNA-binding domain